MNFLLITYFTSSFSIAGDVCWENEAQQCHQYEAGADSRPEGAAAQQMIPPDYTFCIHDCQSVWLKVSHYHRQPQQQHWHSVVTLPWQCSIQLHRTAASVCLFLATRPFSFNLEKTVFVWLSINCILICMKLERWSLSEASQHFLGRRDRVGTCDSQH